MTIRSSTQALERQKWKRSQTLCTVFEVRRQDGFVLRWTDHDRPLTIDGYVYAPALFGTISAERREAALRSGNQEASGVIDGTSITIPDLLGHKYRGARVEQRVVDWRMPWLWHYRAVKRVRQMSYDGSGWVATLEGISASLQQSVGGYFGGTHSEQCTHALASAKCGADISRDLIYAQTSFTVNGTGTTALLVKGSSVSWTTDQWVGFYFHARTGAQRGKERRVVANTSDTLTLDRALDDAIANGITGWLGQGPRVDTVSTQRMTFTINSSDFAGGYADDYFRDGEWEWTTGDNAGVVSPIVGFVESTRTVELLFPTPFDLASGDRGILRPGCDGLRGTCIAKFRQFPFKEGTTTASSTTTVVNDTGAGLTSNVYAGGNYYLRITSGALSGTQRLITANGTTSYTVSPAFASAPLSGVTYEVVKSNIDNFGGTDTYSPGANKTLEQPL